tara:strand:+ start:1387 stop:1632 length:246 start_codon:yes stop_codon:yes gene_type:complete
LGIGDIMRGYSQVVMEANQNAEKTIGVELGTLCIKLKYPVQKVAERLHISRQSVYDWFSGKAKPAKSKHDLVQKLMEELTA